MADQGNLAAVLGNLATAIANMNAPAAPNAAAPVLDPFAAADPFDLSSRAGDAAFKQACAAITPHWDGTIDKFPPFVISLKVRAREAHWTAPAPTGIAEIGGHNIFDDYFSLTPAEVEAARVARNNDRAVQNLSLIHI